MAEGTMPAAVQRVGNIWHFQDARHFGLNLFDDRFGRATLPPCRNTAIKRASAIRADVSGSAP
jgi:hypothetical protein